MANLDFFGWLGRFLKKICFGFELGGYSGNFDHAAAKFRMIKLNLQWMTFDWNEDTVYP